MVEAQNNLPLFELPTEPEAPVPDSAKIAAVADTHPILEYEDRTSEAARDQGHGPQERGIPLEDEDHPRRKPEAIAAQKKAAAKRRRRSRRESRYTDVKENDADSNPAYMTDEEQAELPVSDPAAMHAARMIVDRTLAPINAEKVARDSQNDPRIALALSRARAERRDKS